MSKVEIILTLKLDRNRLNGLKRSAEYNRRSLEDEISLKIEDWPPRRDLEDTLFSLGPDQFCWVLQGLGTKKLIIKGHLDLLPALRKALLIADVDERLSIEVDK